MFMLVTRQNVDRQNPELAFVHVPGFDGLGFDDVRIRVWVRHRVGFNGPEWLII